MGCVVVRLTSKWDRGRVAEPVDERILRHILVDQNGCWVWQGQRYPHTDRQLPYGKINVGSRREGSRRNAKAHRISYETFVGPIPEGLTLDHMCDNPPCVNPDHLVPMTQRANNIKPTSRGASGRNARKTHCPAGHEYTPENTVVVRAKHGPARRCRTCLIAQGRQCA